MVAYNFRQEFAGDVADLVKRQTIRADGKRRHARPGELLQLYTGMRTKGCRKLVLPDPPCKSTEPIAIDFNYYSEGEYGITATVSGKRLTDQELEALAQADGFENVDAMHWFFCTTHRVPFRGTLIKW